MNLQELLEKEFRDFDIVDLRDGQIYMGIGLSCVRFHVPATNAYVASRFRVVENSKQGKLPDLKQVKKRLEKVFNEKRTN